MMQGNKIVCFLIGMAVFSSCVEKRIYEKQFREYTPFPETHGKNSEQFEEENPEVKDKPILQKDALFGKKEIADWVYNNFSDYFQNYNLSCEPAMIRMICGLWGITDLTEDDIMNMMPGHPSNPELGFVMENVRGDIYYADGSVNWANYGAHAEVVAATLNKILEAYKLDSFYYIEIDYLDDKELSNFIYKEEKCMGAVIWVAAYIDGEKPEVNEIGQVLGEHVQYVSPILDEHGKMLVYDVWPWENQPFHLHKPFNRDLFDYIVILLMRKQ